MSRRAETVEEPETQSISTGRNNGYRGGYMQDQDGLDSTERTALLGVDAGRIPTSDDDSRQRASWAGYDEFLDKPEWRRPSVYWLLGPYALFTLAFGGSLVPKLNLYIELVCNRYLAERAVVDPNFHFAPVVPGGDNKQCRTPEVQSIVATFMLVMSVTVGVLSAFTAPKLGALSDRYGRKRLLVVASAGGVVAEILTILTAKNPEVIHYNWLLVGAVFDGLSGSFTAGSVISHSYTSDCTPPSQRGVAIGYLHACLFSGIALGPLLAAYLAKWTDSLLSVFYVVLGCHIFFILFILLVLPESLSKKRQHLAREKHAQAKEQRIYDYNYMLSSLSVENDVMFLQRGWLKLRTSNPFGPLKILVPSAPGTSKVRRNLLLLAAIDTVLLGVAMSSGQVILLYSELIFGWGNFETSRFISAVSMVRVLALMTILPGVTYLFRTRPALLRRREFGAVPETHGGADKLDIWLLRVAIVSDVIGVTGYIFARAPSLFVLCGLITAIGGLGSATIQAALTKHIPADRVGQLLGATGLLQALSRVFAPILFNGLYAKTVGTFPQAIFVMLAAMYGAMVILSMFVQPHVYLRDEDEIPSPLSSQEHLENAEALSDDELMPRIP